MKKVNPIQSFIKGAAILPIVIFMFLACTNDPYLEPVPDVVKSTKSDLFQSDLKPHSESQNAKQFIAQLNGGQEVPANNSKGRGNAIFQLKEDGLHYKLIVANIENITMAHIHLAPAGSNGGVVVWLYPSSPPPMLIPGKSNGILATGIITSANLVGALAGQSLEALLNELSSEGAYVNVHTSQFPGGEIRGQIQQKGN